MATTIETDLNGNATKKVTSKKVRVFQGTGKGLSFERVYTREGVHPFEEVEWELRTAAITNERGETVFEQRDVEIPASWSQMATNVVVSKYFRGKLGTPARERSVKQLIMRVVNAITAWGKKDGIFATDADMNAFSDELAYLILHQKMAFNSPVWFNVGVEERPQASACFINSVEDTMESIMTLAKTECMLFKWGSGAGSNLSTIRSSKEHLSGGGTASGPVSFMRGYDAFAGVVKCVTGDTLVWTDAGAVPIVEAKGRIATGKGLSTISEFHVNTPKPIHGIRLGHTELSVRGTGNHPIMVMTEDGIAWKHLEELTPGDAVAVARGHWSVQEDPKLTYESTINEAYRKKDYVIPTQMTPALGLVLGLLVAEGSIDANRVRMTNGDDDTVAAFVDAWEQCFGYRPEPRRSATKNCWDVSSHCVDVVRFLAGLGIASPAQAKIVPSVIFKSSKETARAFLRAYFEGDGHNGRDVAAVSASKTLRDQLQQLLLALGYLASAHTTSHGFYGLRLGGESAERFRQEIGFLSERKKHWTLDAPDQHNTNVDVIPGLVSAVRRYHVGSGMFETVDGREKLKMGFFNRSGDNVSVAWLRANPETVQNLAKLNKGLYDAVVETLEFGYFWDRVDATWVDEPEPTYDITVPGEHSFVGNGIICHNSGGKTRRAAKMVILDAGHPDVMEFVWSKANEEKKAWALIDAGYDGGFNVPGGAYDSIYFQNANHSVRVTDEFMKAVVEDKPWTTRGVCDGQPKDTLPARDVMKAISEAAWLCGDPGLQYDTTINDWHTCSNTDRIYASNPCVTADTLVATSEGWKRIDQMLTRAHEVIGADGELHPIAPAFKTGHKPVYRLRTRAGFELKLTGDHRVWTKNRGDVPASELSVDDVLTLGRPAFGQEALDADFAQYVGLMLGDGCITGQEKAAVLTLGPSEMNVALVAQAAITRWQKTYAPDGRGARDVNINQPQDTLRLSTASRCVVEALERWAILDQGSTQKALRPEAMMLNREAAAALLRGLFTADGTVANYGDKSQYVSLESTSETLLSQVQLMLLSFGIKAKLYRNRRPLGQTMALLPDGKGGRKEYPVEQLHSLRISRQGRFDFEAQIGFVEGSEKMARLQELNAQVSAYADPLVDHVETLEFIGEEDVYDLTEPVTSHFVAAGLVVHNCSEYLFLNDTACNLASLNLLTFRDEAGEFDVERFKHAVRLTLTAQEIIVPNASYPTPQIEKNSHVFRPLGLGFTNLGALLMVRGLPYDSEQGRAYAGAITALMCGESYAQSARIAQTTGPFEGYPLNEEPMLRVIKNHADAVETLPKVWAPIEQDPILSAARDSWREALELGKQTGFRNSQTTVLAPTGCLTADTMILSSKGLLPIGELGDMYGEDWQPLALKVPQEQEVHHTTQFFVNGEDHVFSVVSARGHQIKATGKHQVRVVDEYGEYVWRRVDELAVGDQLVLRIGGHESVLQDAPLVPMMSVESNQHPRANEFTQPKVMDASLAQLLGYYAGDGYLKDRGGFHLVVHEQDQDLLTYFSEQGAKVFGMEARCEPRQGCQVLHFNSRSLVPWFTVNGLNKPKGNEGQGAEGACIPLSVLSSRTDVLCAFLQGLFEADGTVYTTRSESPIVSLTTVSAKLARQVHVALESLGIRSTLTARAPGESLGERVKYRVRPASVADVRVFAQKIGFISERKQGRLTSSLEAFTGVEDRGHRLESRAVLVDLYERSMGLSNEVRQDIRARMVQGVANVSWMRRLIEDHPSLAQSKAGALLALGELQFVAVDELDALGVLPTFDISVPHRNTYIANGFVTHNTISFLMDCDTTGVEPDIALIKYKKLVGGGYFKIVNQAVPEALTRLGYDAQQKQEILDYLMDRETIEGAPHVRPEHVPVFDCAFKPANGTRSILPMGHVRMMAATQPFLSGAISKTVNMPSAATVDEIAQVYVDAWKLGLKAIAIYRDGCKRTQPLSTKLDDGNGNKEEVQAVAAAPAAAVSDESAAMIIAQSALGATQGRRRLGDERPSITHKFSIAGHEGYITVGMYEDGQPGELFITMSKEGSMISGLMDSFATSISLCLQYGVPLDVLVDKFCFTRFEPSGFTNNPRIRMAKSITDYIFRWLADKFLPQDQKSKYFPHDQPEDHQPALSASVSEALAASRAAQGSVATAAAKPQAAVAAKADFSKATPGSVVYDAASPKKVINAQSDSPPCHVCGSMTIRSGACYLCQTCGATTGCG